jgi:hypothetical protein
MPNPSQSSINMQQNISQARAQLLELSFLLAGWKAFNREARERLAIAQKWDSEERRSPKETPACPLAQNHSPQ